MESTGLPGCIQISEVTYQTLTGSGGDLISAPGSGLGGGGAWAAAAAAAAAQQGTLWDADVWEERGMVEVKGKVRQREGGVWMCLQRGRSGAHGVWHDDMGLGLGT